MQIGYLNDTATPLRLLSIELLNAGNETINQFIGDVTIEAGKSFEAIAFNDNDVQFNIFRKIRVKTDVTAGSLVVLDVAGNVIEQYPINPNTAYQTGDNNINNVYDVSFTSIKNFTPKPKLFDRTPE